MYDDVEEGLQGKVGEDRFEKDRRKGYDKVWLVHVA